jgi:hypothetical protein
VWLIELALAFPHLPKRRDQTARFIEFQYPRVRAVVRGVAFSHVDLAVRRDENIIRLPEKFLACPATRFSQREQQLAIRTEFINLMTFASQRFQRLARGRSSSVPASRIFADARLPSRTEFTPGY